MNLSISNGDEEAERAERLMEERREEEYHERRYREKMKANKGNAQE